MQNRAKKLIEWVFGADRSRRLAFIARGTRFRLGHRSDFRLTRKKYDVLFCCDPTRWQNVKLVVEELSRKRPDLTVGVAFPGHAEGIEDFSKLAGVTAIAYATLYALPLFDTKVLYLPIPDLPRALSPRGAIVVHGLMSIASIDGVYLDHHFDEFDYVLCGGPHHIDAFGKLALRRPILSGLKLLPAGYPKLDLMLASLSASRSAGSSTTSTVVYAPTHVNAANETLASLRTHGEAIVETLLAGGHRVIFRPHPLSFLDADRPLVDRICERHAVHSRFSVDRSKDYTQSYSSADLMVTDLSGTGFTFSLTFSRPCLFFAPHGDAEEGLTGIQFDSRHRIGGLVRNIGEMIEKTEQLCRTDMTAEIERFREEFVFNVGNSARYIVDCLEDILADRERPEWVRL